MSRVETIGNGVTLYLGDCREILPTLGKVDAVVTSPPYGQQRDYGEKVDDWRALVSGALCNMPSAHEAQILVNLGLVHRNGEVVPYWQPLIDDMRAAGWRHFGWYTWDQLSGMMGDWQGRLAPSFEFVFHFNRVARSVNKTKPTLGGKVHGTGIRHRDGSLKLQSGDGNQVNPTKIPDSVIRTHRETQGGIPEAAHPARFPVEFAKELIAPFTDIGQTVVDPFMGIGTTGVASAKLGRQFIGIEIEPKYFDIACRRIEQATKQPDMLVQLEKRAAEIQQTLDLSETPPSVMAAE